MRIVVYSVSVEVQIISIYSYIYIGICPLFLSPWYLLLLLFYAGPVLSNPSSCWSATRPLSGFTRYSYIYMYIYVFLFLSPRYILCFSFPFRAGAVQSLLVLVRHSFSIYTYVSLCLPPLYHRSFLFFKGWCRAIPPRFGPPLVLQAPHLRHPRFGLKV